MVGQDTRCAPTLLIFVLGEDGYNRNSRIRPVMRDSSVIPDTVTSVLCKFMVADYSGRVSGYWQGFSF